MIISKPPGSRRIAMKTISETPKHRQQRLPQAGGDVDEEAHSSASGRRTVFLVSLRGEGVETPQGVGARTARRVRASRNRTMRRWRFVPASGQAGDGSPGLQAKQG